MHLLHPLSSSPRNGQKWHNLIAFHYLAYDYEVGVLEQTCQCFLHHLKHTWVSKVSMWKPRFFFKAPHVSTTVDNKIPVLQPLLLTSPPK